MRSRHKDRHSATIMKQQLEKNTNEQIDKTDRKVVVGFVSDTETSWQAKNNTHTTDRKKEDIIHHHHDHHHG